MGAGAGAGKNPLKTTATKNREALPGSRTFLEPEPVKKNYKLIQGGGSQAFFRRNRSRELGSGEKRYRLQNTEAYKLNINIIV